MKLSTCTMVGQALVGAVLSNTGIATSARAQTATRVQLEITCQGSGVQGIAEGVIGDPDMNPARFRITCSPSTPRNRATITAMGDPDMMPWSVKVTLTDARGVSTSREARGIGLPARVTTTAVGNLNERVDFQAVAITNPDE
jgi:hypothetical protein